MNEQIFFDSYEELQIIKETERVKIASVFYKTRETVCILKVYYGRDLTEAYQKLMKLKDRNLTVIYDTVFYQNSTFILEEMLDGETLADRLEYYGTFSEEEVIDIICQVCQGIKLLHSQNPPLIHRDIKPSNVILKADGSVKLIDFDTIRVYQEGKEEDTRQLGTKEYASPEHYGYGQTGPASDIYSIGVMMNELLSGEVLENHQPTYRGRLLPVINRCIQVDSKRRFHTVGELEKELGTYRHKWGGIVRNYKKILIGAAAVVLLGIAFVVFSPEGSEKWPDLQAVYESEGSPALLLENEKVSRGLKELLGSQYSYVNQCMDYIDSGTLSYKEGYYFMDGGVPGLYTIMEAAICLSDEEQIECAYIDGSVITYYASDSSFYSGPSSSMLTWMASFPEKTIEFHENPSYAEPEDISGTYYCEERTAHLEIKKSGDDSGYEIEGMAWWGDNSGEVEGTLGQIDACHFTFMYDFDRESDPENAPKLYLTVFENQLVVYTKEGEQSYWGGLNVAFDGIYQKR